MMCLRVATMNMRSLRVQRTDCDCDRVGAVLAIMDRHRLDALALPETRKTSLPAIEAACRCAGFYLCANDVCLDRASRPTGGLACITRWHTKWLRTDFPDNAFLPIVLHHPQEAPMVWINTYLSASETRLREAYAQRLLGYAQSSAQDLFVCGDFNMECSEWPLFEAAAVGLVHSVGELVGFDGRQGTRSSARVIDFGLVRGGIHPSARFTDSGVADHLLAAYSTRIKRVPVSAGRNASSWRSRATLRVPATSSRRCGRRSSPGSMQPSVARISHALGACFRALGKWFWRRLSEVARSGDAAPNLDHMRQPRRAR